MERIAECPEQLKYDLPPELQGKLWGGKWRGQLQDWYLARFKGDDSDVNIATKQNHFRMRTGRFKSKKCAENLS